MDTPDAGAINKLNRPKTKKNPHSQTWLWGFYWRRERDSNPRGIAPKLISSQPRYDHFDTLPYLLLLIFYYTKTAHIFYQNNPRDRKSVV